MAEFSQLQRQVQAQKQVQKMSQRQIQAVNMLQMNGRDLREEILKQVEENPVLEIVRDPYRAQIQREIRQASFDKQAALEAQEDHKETLQQHLMSQLNMINLSQDEYDLSQKLIYNLDKNGFYGSLLAPETLLDRARPLQNKRMLERCIQRIQSMDPIGVCCKNFEESLLVQARAVDEAPDLALFLLDGHFDFLVPPTPERVLAKLNNFKADYHKKSFGGKLALDDIKISLKTVEEAIGFIQTLNPYPAGDYISDISAAEFNQPDIVLRVDRVEGHLFEDDFSSGKIATNGSFYFQVKYASGILPEVRINETGGFDKALVDKARFFLSNLAFRENTIILQGCAIVSAQKDFFLNGPGHIKPLTRRQVAEQLQIHESTVSRMSAKKSSKYIQSEWGLFPASYFFSSGVEADSGIGKTVSAEAIQFKIGALLEEAESRGQSLSDNQLTKILNDEGIKIARRTVAKYRMNAGLKNSYGK